MRDQTEVCLLSRGAMCSHPYPPYYRVAFASSVIPYPLPHRLALRLAFPCGRATGLPRSADVPEWGRPHLYAGGSPSVPEEFGASGPGHVPFWSKPVSIFGLFNVTTFTSGSRPLTMPPNPGAPTASMLAVTASPHGLAATLSGEGALSQGLRTVRLLRPHALIGY